MCAITLTTLQTCKHELPTIQLCHEAIKCLEKPKKKPQHGVEAILPTLCTESLGWTLFKKIDAPVLCEGCKMWLHLKGKTTYSMLSDQYSAVKEDGEVVGSTAEQEMKTQGVEERDEEGKENDTLVKRTDVNEMQKLQSKLSRTFGVTGQRRKKTI